jgi:hypothetical protein
VALGSAATTDSGTIFYHGTDATSAADILQNGFNLQKGEQLGGDGQLYTTVNPSYAEFFAKANPVGDTNAAIVAFTLSNSVINQLSQAGMVQYAPGSVYIFQRGAIPTVNAAPAP